MTDRELHTVLEELLNSSRFSAEALERSIREHPEILEDGVESYLSLLAQAQVESKAREKVNDLARLLRRLRTESLPVVLADEASRSRIRAARRARERRLTAARQRFLEWRKQPRSNQQPESSLRSLPSLAEVVARIRAIAIAERPQPYGRNILGPHAGGYPVPDYVFRGESGVYKNTFSSMRRLSASGRAMEDVAHICARLVSAFQDKYGLESKEAIGFLQHYGYPTDYIDVTSDVSVAASFASSLRVGDEGAICTLRTKPLVEREALIDLRQHPMAPRPRQQSAFAVHLSEYPDLKAPETVEALQLNWMEFRFTELDEARFVPDFGLLDARSDQVAGLIWLLIGDCAKFSDEAAALLSKRIDSAPVFTIVAANGTQELACEDDVMPEHPIDDEEFRRHEYQFWSDAFGNPEELPLPPKFKRSLRSVADLEPGAILRIMTARALGQIGTPVKFREQTKYPPIVPS
jgi:FRG domain